MININTKITFENGSAIETIETKSNTIRGYRAKPILLYGDSYYEFLANINEIIDKFDNINNDNIKLPNQILYVSSSKYKNKEKEKGKNDN